MEDQILWENTIGKLLGDDSPCRNCLVKPSCRRSFVDKSACEDLAIAMEKAIKEHKNES
jgi:hypothetical protein